MIPSKLAMIPWVALALPLACITPASLDTSASEAKWSGERPRQDSTDNLRVFSGGMVFDSTAVGAGPGLEIETMVHKDGGTFGIGVPLAVKENGALILRAGFEFVDSDDGEHDREEGFGIGAGLGYRHYFGWERDGWLLGGRLDFWVAEIDWENDLVGGGQLDGRTDVIVLRPGLEAGYGLWLSDEWRIDFLTAAGFDLYLDTDGEDVGTDNLRLSVGLALRYGF